MRSLRGLLAALAVLLPAAANAQAILQGGPWTPGHVPMYSASGSTQPIVQDSGGAGGGPAGTGLSDLGITARGTGTPPYASQGTGPFGTNFCDNDAPTTNTTGYHFLCLSPNAQGGGLISYGAVGAASQLPFTLNINGVNYQFPFAVGGIVGPGTTVVGHMATWANTNGTLLADSGYVPLRPSNNLSDVSNPATALANLGGISSTGATLTNPTINGATIANAASIVSAGPVQFNQGATLPFCPTTGCISGTTQTAALQTFSTTLNGGKLETGTAFNAVLGTGFVHNWSVSTAFTANQEVFGATSNVYVETVSSCTTSSSGSGPTGTGTGIADGTCLWNFEQSAIFYGKINTSFFTSVAGALAPSASWGIYNDFTVMAGTPTLNFWAAEEIAVSNYGSSCAVGAQSCSGLLIDGFVTNPGTFAIEIAPQSSSAKAWHYGMLMSSFTAINADIGIEDDANYGVVLSDIGSHTHSVASIADLSTSPVGLYLSGTYSNRAIIASGTIFATGETLGNQAASGATPSQLGFDASTSSTPGANPKINLIATGYGANTFGIGVSAGSQDYMVAIGAAHTFYANGTVLAAMNATKLQMSVPVDGPSYAIGSLPSCVAGLSGARAVVTNGQTTPTYLGAVSTTGAVVAGVLCNGSGWVYD